MKLIAWWKQNFLFAEFLLSAVIAVVFIAWAMLFHGLPSINQTIAGNRSVVYTAIATIFGSLFGFVIAAISIVLGFSGTKQLEAIRSSANFKALWDIFQSAIKTLSSATFAAIAGLIFDRDASTSSPIAPSDLPRHLTLGQVCLYLCIFTTLLSVLRLARCVWVLERLILLVTKPSQARSGE